ncbi:hypothetical protein BGS_0450 [Beggiatoa sp. SS]|nr:hypothetical protein BGS_0450 [Beggiatoa sp. SS]
MVENEQSNAIGFAFAIKKEINAKDAKKALKISFSRQSFGVQKLCLRSFASFASLAFIFRFLVKAKK